MIDLILFAAIAGVFFGGFKAGNKYKTLKDMCVAAHEAVSGK